MILVCCLQVICLVRCSHHAVDPWFQFVWNFVEGVATHGSIVSFSSSLSGSTRKQPVEH